ncbi:MAG: hypothetical protein ONB16_03460 [candidate division KSB1 bacterium]|nr:hypothetical protein [candidate division KSB1 bacterium]MDZ7318014.1 hypothetical protein [candidate division KSB1 bacterium]MDZ7341583.1 hypothetical protein [candidate division KSB1 bacterium]
MESKGVNEKNTMVKQSYDFLIAVDWEYDHDFVQILERIAQQEYWLTTYTVLPQNLEETIARLHRGEIEFRFFYDRASDTSPEFYALHQLLLDRKVPILDSIENLTRAADKATMHLEFIANGLNAPYTIIIPPFNTTEHIYLSVVDLAKLGRPFIIKPANTTGGGIGVVDGAETLQDVLQARQKYKTDKYLLQEKVKPIEKDGFRFWFRCFYSCGLVACCWWNDLTHEYQMLTPDQIAVYQLGLLFTQVRKIAQISRLQFFSTEIALNERGQFVVIDYVNEICDMRLKSQHFDGVPDTIVEQIARYLVRHVDNQIHRAMACDHPLDGEIVDDRNLNHLRESSQQLPPA